VGIKANLILEYLVRENGKRHRVRKRSGRKGGSPLGQLKQGLSWAGKITLIRGKEGGKRSERSHLGGQGGSKKGNLAFFRETRSIFDGGGDFFRNLRKGGIVCSEFGKKGRRHQLEGRKLSSPSYKQWAFPSGDEWAKTGSPNIPYSLEEKGGRESEDAGRKKGKKEKGGEGGPRRLKEMEGVSVGCSILHLFYFDEKRKRRA